MKNKYHFKGIIPVDTAPAPVRQSPYRFKGILPVKASPMKRSASDGIMTIINAHRREMLQAGTLAGKKRVLKKYLEAYPRVLIAEIGRNAPNDAQRELLQMERRINARARQAVRARDEATFNRFANAWYMQAQNFVRTFRRNTGKSAASVKRFTANEARGLFSSFGYTLPRGNTLRVRQGSRSRVIVEFPVDADRARIHLRQLLQEMRSTPGTGVLRASGEVFQRGANLSVLRFVIQVDPRLL